jgi:hypothetical protein
MTIFGAGLGGELDRGHAHAGASGLDQGDLAGLQASELEQAVVGGAEGHRDHRGLLGGEAVRDLPGGLGGDGAELGVAAPAAGRADLVADLVVGDLAPTSITSPAAW